MTRLYLRNSNNATSGLPTTEQSTKAITGSNYFIIQSTNKDMTETIGTAQTSVTKRIANSTTMLYFGKWVSAPIVATTIDNNTWTLNFAAFTDDLSSNFPVSGSNKSIWVNCYVWRPGTSTKIGTVLDDNTNAVYNEPSAADTEKVMHGTFTGSQVTGIQSNDVLILEIWTDMTATPSQNWDGIIYFDGTTVNTTANATVSNHASFLETPQDIFSAAAGPVDCTVTGKVVARKHIIHG